MSHETADTVSTCEITVCNRWLCVLAQLHLQGTPAAIISYTQFNTGVLSSNKIYYMETVKFGRLLVTSKIKQN